MILECYALFRFPEVRVHLALRPSSRAGDDATWDHAEGALRAALHASGHPYAINPGDGAFYGPKIDFKVLDALKREHQLGTIQLDYVLKYCPVRSMFDRQSLVTNWFAPAIPGAPKAAERYAQPVWKVHAHGDHKPTGQFEPPVDVVRIKAGDTILSTDLGELPQGVYCLRIVAAVPADISADDFRKNLFVVLAVNDKLDGGDSTYRARIGYCDQFYSVAELYFHAVEKRRFRATLRMDPAGEVPLLVRNVPFDNALAGVQRGAHKKKANDPFPAEWIQRIKDAEAKRAADPVAMDKRRKRDALIWQNYPHVNRRFAHILDSTQCGMRLRAPNTVQGMTEKAIAEQFGAWASPAPEWEFPHSRHPDVFLRNEKLNLNYTFADLQAGRPLPDPFPFKDDGNGVVDDVHGMNAAADSGDPVDLNGHGTQVAGLVALGGIGARNRRFHQARNGA